MTQRTTTAALAALGLTDLALSLWLFKIGVAEEGNPLMALLLAHGAPTFAAAKLALLCGPLALIGWASPRHPRFVLQVSRIGVAAYAAALVFGVSRVAWNDRSELKLIVQKPPAIPQLVLPGSGHLPDLHRPTRGLGGPVSSD